MASWLDTASTIERWTLRTRSLRRWMISPQPPVRSYWSPWRSGQSIASLSWLIRRWGRARRARRLSSGQMKMVIALFLVFSRVPWWIRVPGVGFFPHGGGHVVSLLMACVVQDQSLNGASTQPLVRDVQRPLLPSPQAPLENWSL